MFKDNFTFTDTNTKENKEHDKQNISIVNSKLKRKRNGFQSHYQSERTEHSGDVVVQVLLGFLEFLLLHFLLPLGQILQLVSHNFDLILHYSLLIVVFHIHILLNALQRFFYTFFVLFLKFLQFFQLLVVLLHLQLMETLAPLNQSLFELVSVFRGEGVLIWIIDT